MLSMDVEVDHKLFKGIRVEFGFRIACDVVSHREW